jgi:hypothetical protein
MAWESELVCRIRSYMKPATMSRRKGLVDRDTVAHALFVTLLPSH